VADVLMRIIDEYPEDESHCNPIALLIVKSGGLEILDSVKRKSAKTKKLYENLLSNASLVRGKKLKNAAKINS
jgi:hypothetical protein